MALPLLAWAALVGAPVLHARPLRLLRAFLALSASLAALVFYTYVRRHFFPVDLPAEVSAAPSDQALPERLLFEFLRWFQQPRLPHDPINNPLAEADFAHRVAGGLRVYLRPGSGVSGSLSGILYRRAVTRSSVFARQHRRCVRVRGAPLSPRLLPGACVAERHRVRTRRGPAPRGADEKSPAYGADREVLARLLVLAVGVGVPGHSALKSASVRPGSGALLVLARVGPAGPAVCFARLPVWLPQKWRKRGGLGRFFGSAGAPDATRSTTVVICILEATRRAIGERQAHLNHFLHVGARGRG